MHRHFLTYFTWLGDELITVPDFPAWVCDVCGRREYDLQALNQLNLLLNSNAGQKHAPSPSGHHARSLLKKARGRAVQSSKSSPGINQRKATRIKTDKSDNSMIRFHPIYPSFNFRNLQSLVPPSQEIASVAKRAPSR